MKKLFSLIVALALGCCFCASASALPAAETVSVPQVSAESAILINAETGAVYFEKSADRPMGMASTTKLMTALVAAKHASLEQTVTIPASAVGVEGSSIYLTEGETLTMEELLYALLLSSANDAATAIAIAVSGSVEAFCALMNEQAGEMGLCHTHFTNPHGLYDENHYTTARELAAIAKEALAHPIIRTIVSTKRATISQGGVPDKRLLLNHNKLLRTYEGAIGMKTGFTKKTGRTLVSAAERNGLTLIAVTLNAPDDWQDHTAMLNYGFANYETVLFASAGALSLTIPVTGGKADTVTVTNTEPLSLTLPKDHGKEQYAITATGHFLYAPLSTGNEIGRVTLTCEGQTISSTLITTQTIESNTPQKKGFVRRIADFFKIE